VNDVAHVAEALKGVGINWDKFLMPDAFKYGFAAAFLGAHHSVSPFELRSDRITESTHVKIVSPWFIMYSPPYFYFHSRVGHRWQTGTDPALLSLHTLNDAPKDLLPSLTINVSQPEALITWLETNNAALISNLSIFLHATSSPSRPPIWSRLFDKLQREATNIQHLSIYWDAEGPWGTRPPWNIEDALHFGLGRSVVFLHGLVQLKVKKGVEIGGFYAKHWPKYLEEKMGLKPVNKQNLPGSFWEWSLRDYQRGTERFDPWTITKDGSFTFW